MTQADTGAGKYFVECSRCHRMIGMILRKMMSELERRVFTCSQCSAELTQRSER
jgi:predicted SprT family Zn-dependent metalloprotease